MLRNFFGKRITAKKRALNVDEIDHLDKNQFLSRQSVILGVLFGFASTTLLFFHDICFLIRTLLKHWAPLKLSWNRFCLSWYWYWPQWFCLDKDHRYRWNFSIIKSNIWWPSFFFFFALECIKILSSILGSMLWNCMDKYRHLVQSIYRSYS